MRKNYLIPSTLAALALLCLAGTALAKGTASMTQTAGSYTITLKLLPTESFVSPAEAKKSANAGDMVNGGGAQPVRKGGAQQPNHHLVVFIKKNGQPTEHATVQMSYTKQNGSGHSVKLPVNRMWVAGKGKKTMHYGNNVKLAPGNYRVHVVINHGPSADFKLHV
jgi:hypothetical protein